MKGFSPWPGKLVPASETTLRKPPGNLRSKVNQCVYFFGSNNFAWLPEDSLKPYAEYKEQNMKLNKSNSFKEAITVIEEYIRRGCPDEIPGPAGDNAAAGSLPSIEDDITAIFPDKNNKSESADSLPASSKGAAAAVANASQKDYSRKPFTSKPKRPAVTNNNISDDTDSLPVKKVKADNSDSGASEETNAKSNSKAGARKILARTSQFLRDTNSGTNNSDLDVGSASAKAKSIRPSSLKFGFIGLGSMGQRLVKNLLNSGHSVTIWNRTPSKCKDFVKEGAHKATTPADVVAAADITFSCLSDPHAVKEIVFGNCGVLAEIRAGKGYVEMTSIDSETSNDVSEAIIARGGRYLEAPVIGNGKQQAEDGNLTVIVSGDRSLFDDCNSCLQAISQHAFYLGGQIGDASKMGLAVSMLMGNLIGSLAESMALADRAGLQQKDLLEVLAMSPLNCETLISKGRAMIDGGFAT
jgi:3-hydroxyisobutyrate dehydrogenase